MPRSVTYIFVQAAFVLSAGSYAGAEITVESWRVITGIVDTQSSDDPSEFAVFEDNVVNPFQDSHEVLLGQSRTSASYDFTWTADTANFHIDTTHFLMELDGRTITEGRITVHPAVDSIIAFDAFFDFSWPSAAIGGSILGFSIFDIAMDEPISSNSDSGGNFDLGAPFGTLALDGSALLLGGRDYLIGYSARIDHFTPTPPGTHGDGTGNIHFTITPVPEPATASLLIAGLLLSRRRRRGCP
jgi:hypothetical protein